MIAFAAILALGAAMVVVWLTNRDGGDSGSTVAGFEPVYEDLEQRRVEAGVSTMGEPADAEAHLHPKLSLYAEGEPVGIPVGIGINPANPPEQMASLHTHESDGTIHMEGMSEATLGQFFRIWGIPFSEREIGPYETDGERSILMWVDGEASKQFDALKLDDGQEVVVAYGTPEQLDAAAL